MSGGVDRAGRLPGLLAYIERQSVSEAHSRRARVRVAARFPPTGPFPSREDVEQALADTAPAPEELSPA